MVLFAIILAMPCYRVLYQRIIFSSQFGDVFLSNENENSMQCYFLVTFFNCFHGGVEHFEHVNAITDVRHHWADIMKRTFIFFSAPVMKT